jgi:hypothetical protein
MIKKLALVLVAVFSFVLQSYDTKSTIGGNDDVLNSTRLASKLNINDRAISLAIKGYQKLKEQGKLINHRYLTIADFSKPSSEERLYIIDMESAELVLQTLVAHGKNSGTLFAKNFSNKNESNKSSLGFYITGNTYFGKHGESLRLTGIENGINDKAAQRAIVLHGANYVSNTAISQMGYLGRSQGCPAVPSNQVQQIIHTIQGESCLFIYAPNQDYLNRSKLVG